MFSLSVGQFFFQFDSLCFYLALFTSSHVVASCLVL